MISPSDEAACQEKMLLSFMESQFNYANIS